jgi:DNA-binding SARP family transcriptional activator
LIEFRVLGPVEAVVEDRRVPLQAAKPRALLGALLLRRNRVVSVDELVHDLWGEEPPDTATKALQGYVSQLRKTLGADRVLTTPPGYSLRVEAGELDLDRFEQLTREGRERLVSGDARAASERFEAALALWRGRPFAEFDGTPFGRDAGARLEEEHLTVTEDRIDADLALARHAALVPELEELAAKEPYRERLRGQLMLALYRSGRQADALGVYRQTRKSLVDELGIEPGEDLQELERAILRHDRSLDVRADPARQIPTGRRRRRPAILAVAALVLAVGIGGALAVALTRDGSSDRPTLETRAAGLPAFVVKLENFLGQSREGRREVAVTINSASRCALARRAAISRLTRVQRNRQSLLQQVAALAVPDRDDTVRASDLLQQSIQASISADWHYRDWLVHRRRCATLAAGPDLDAARATDVQATRMKETFVQAFNPLARRFGKRTWNAGEF